MPSDAAEARSGLSCGAVLNDGAPCYHPKCYLTPPSHRTLTRAVAIDVPILVLYMLALSVGLRLEAHEQSQDGQDGEYKNLLC